MWKVVLTGPAAMVQPVRPRPYRFFKGEKRRRLDSNLTCVIECPLQALRRSLGRLRGFKAKKKGKLVQHVCTNFSSMIRLSELTIIFHVLQQGFSSLPQTLILMHHSFTRLLRTVP